MGILLSYLAALDVAHRHGALRSPVWALGSQQLGGSPAELSRWAAGQGYATMAAKPSFRALLRDRYGVTEYLDFDLNNDADRRLDLNAPLPAELRCGAGTVLDSGTLEHVFDIRRAIENTHDMLAPGGSLVTLAPVSWWDHGFVNLNPRFFRAVASANGYEPLAEGIVFRVALPGVGVRFKLVLVRDGAVRPRARLWTDRLMNRLMPAQALFFFCARKREDASFVLPSDVFGNF